MAAPIGAMGPRKKSRQPLWKRQLARQETASIFALDVGREICGASRGVMDISGAAAIIPNARQPLMIIRACLLSAECGNEINKFRREKTWMIYQRLL